MLKRGFSFAPGYRLESFLGRGQFGQVWRATAPGGAVAAVKFIDLSGGEGAKEHEGIKRVKQIRHANLMPITAIWLLDGQGKAIEDAPNFAEETVSLGPRLDPMATSDALPTEPSLHLSQLGPLEATGMVVMPQEEPAWLAVAMLLGGKSLQQRLRECVKNGMPGIPPKELIAYMDESAKGLDFLNIAQHDLGEGLVAIQHCDVKPANIVLLGSSAVVCDFGLARILSRNQVTATSAAGTPAYMAPEAIAGRPCKTSDQYSLAVTYYHLRTGTLPIADGTLWEVLDAHKTGKLDLSRVPEHEQSVLRRATSLAWESRFESNGDFVESLREALRVEGHTRPVMMPSGSSLASPSSLPTSAFDPSLTLMPTPGSAASGETAAIDHQGPTVGLHGSGDTKNDSVIQGTALATSSKAQADGDRLWWQQPKWVASGAAVVLVPMLLLASFNLFGDSNADGSGGDGGELVVSEGDRKDLSTVDASSLSGSPLDWLVEASAKLNTDEAAARKLFEAALAEDPSLLTPVPTLLTGHANDVMQLEFSHDGRHLVTVADNPAPFAWAIGKFVSRRIGESSFTVEKLTGEGVEDLVIDLVADPVRNAVAFADQSGNLAVASFSDPAKATDRWKLPSGDPVSIAWRPDSSAVVVATDFEPSIIVCELPADPTRKPYQFELANPIKRIEMDPLGQWLLVHDGNGTVSKIAWDDIQSVKQSVGAPPLVALTSEATPVSIMTMAKGVSPTESVVITGGESGEITAWPLGAGGKQLRQTSLHTRSVTALAVSAIGMAGPIASGDDEGVIGIWYPNAAKAEKRQAHTASISSIKLSSDGQWMAAAALDGDVTLWDLHNDAMPTVRLKTANAGPAHCVGLDDSGRWLAVGHADGNVALWDLRHAKFLVGKTLDQQPRRSMPRQSPPQLEKPKQQKTLPVT